MAASPLFLAALVVSTNFAEPLSEAQRKQAREWIEAMKQSPRGPYQGVMWFCKDGAVLLPKSYACVEHGGGVQYGVLTREAEKLGAMGLHVGTVLASLDAGVVLPNHYYRARSLIVEAYLERALDGWALEKAKDYRGFRQMEDEEEAARWLLIELARNADVIEKNRSLLVRFMHALPYGTGGSLAQEVRALAGVIGDADMKGFGDLRFKIHAMPEPSDIEKVEAYLASQNDADLKTKATELIEKMRAYYDVKRRIERLKEVKRWIRDTETRKMIDTFAEVDPANGPELVRLGTELILTADAAIAKGRSNVQSERNLLLLHVMALVEELWIGVTADLSRRPMSRAEDLELITNLVSSAGALGWLSEREHTELKRTLVRMQSARPSVASLKTLLGHVPLGKAVTSDEATIDALARQGKWAHAEQYARSLKDLTRILEWTRARLLADVNLPLERYASIEPRARGVIDDQLRSSLILPLAALLDRLSADVEKLRGGGHKLVGLTAGTGSLRGENAGLASGPLRILGAGEDPAALERTQIVLLFDLPPELPPVAGILTVGAAGSLSHVSLLARNLGIPHATIGGEVAAKLKEHQGEEVVIGVSAGGRVWLGLHAALSAEQKKHFVARPKLNKPFLTIDSSSLDLSNHRVHLLDDISEKSSGVIVGPKAAELGRLRRLFPDRVSNAAVIPFGAFLAHVDRAEEGQPSPMATLRTAYEKVRLRKLSPDEAEKELLIELEKFRDAIATMPFVDGFEEEVRASLTHLGKPNTFGVFVRSDTNVEDLKEFTGAGLNRTVANRVRFEDILAAIRLVWASPFTERSFRWRQRILTNPEHVYPSVILHKTVPCEISGVMVTTDLETGKPGLTVSVSEGVAAVVDGGAPETVVIDSGKVRLLASSRSATCKIIPKPPAQGVSRAAAKGLDPLLGEKQIAEVEALAKEVLEKIPAPDGLPWDIEFGFAGGRAYLMQIRPLRTSRAAVIHPFLSALDKKSRMRQKIIDLNEGVP